MSAREDSRALIIFIKNPVEGKVKTRLARDVGSARALDIYLKLLEHTRKTALEVDCTRRLYYSDSIDNDDWDPDQFEKFVQAKGDLGNKMKHAFSETLEHASSALIIGSDCAQLNAEIITKAFEALHSYDLVIGPTLDGGYYLLGMKSCHPDLFEEMEWSTSTVCSETLQRAESKQLSVFQLPILSDIDFLEDWEKYGLD